jgi:nesprin-1
MVYKKIFGVQKLLAEREDQYRDHRLYKDAHDDLIGWLSRAREKVPSIKQQSISDKVAIENSVAPLEVAAKINIKLPIF